MHFPEFEKPSPRRRNLWLAIALWAVVGTAHGDVAEDFAVGTERYRDGDMMGAMVPLKRAADAGHAGAQALYGDILDKADMDEEGIAYLRRAAEQGNADGQYGLAVMLLAGEGAPRDPAQAARLLRLAAAQQHVLAINALAQAYLQGDAKLGADATDSDEARQMLTQAADHGYLPAIDALAEAYVSGRFGLPPDTARAAALREKATAVRARRGNGDSS